MARESFYKVLGIEPDATKKEIDKAYRKKALEFHPDKNFGLSSEDAQKNHEKILLINEAYRILSDEVERLNYDKVQSTRRFGLADLAPVEISGLLTSPRTPQSETFKILYAKYLEDFKLAPARVRVQNSAEWESPELFKQLRDYEKNAASPGVISFNKLLTPEFAVTLFKSFLQRKYYGTSLLYVKNYIFNCMNKLSKQNTNKETLGLYEGIYDIMSMISDETLESKLYASIQKILQFAKVSVHYAGAAEMVFILPLIQDFDFRDLITQSLSQSWDKPDQRPLKEQLREQFTSKQDKKLENDETGEESEYQHRLLGYQKRCLKVIERELSAESLRELAYLCIDFIGFLSGIPAVTSNLLQQAALLFQKASELETDPVKQMADEMLVLQLSASASSIARRDTPFIDIHIHQNTLRFFSRFKYENLLADRIQKDTEAHIRHQAEIFPCFENQGSPLDLVANMKNNLLFMRQIIQGLIGYIEYNKTRDPIDKIQVNYKSFKILMKGYSACLDGWYSDGDDTLKEKKLRIEAMESLLREKGWTSDDVASILNNNGFMVNSDEDGYISWRKPSSFPKDMKIYKSIDGIEFDHKNGKVSLALNQWKEGTPEHQQAFCDLDLLEIVERGISGVYFSLDAADEEVQNHPFQKVKFGPKSLYQTSLLTVLLHADYLLKFFTTGHEVQGKHPFNIRTLSKLTEGLPDRLKSILSEFQQGTSSSDLHRFWIEATYVPTLEEKLEEGEITRYTFGDIRMTVKKHSMKFNSKGEMVDTKDDSEGWNIYVLDDEQISEINDKKRTVKSPAIIQVNGTNEFYFHESGDFLLNPQKVEISDLMLKELKKQKLDANFSVIHTSTDFEKRTADNSQFIYQLTREITSKSGKSHHFTKEEIFAQEFTEHYDVFCQYFPVFERLKQLSRVSAVINLMNRHRQNNKSTIDAMQEELDDAPGWLRKEAEFALIIANSKKITLLESMNTLSKIYAQDLHEQTTHLQGLYNEFRNRPPIPLVHAGSPDVVARCNEIYNDVFADLVTRLGQATANQEAHRIWPEAITPHVNTIVNNYNTQINAANAARPANFRQQIYVAFTVLGLPASTYNPIIDQFVAGNVQPLAQALAERTRRQATQQLKDHFQEIFSGYQQADINAVFNGNPQPLATAIGLIEAKGTVAHHKSELNRFIAGRKAMELSLVSWGLGISSEQAFDLSDVCDWVPTSFGRHTGGRVQGGVLIMPSIMTQKEANAISMGLKTPLNSAFSSGLAPFAISNGESFIRSLQSKLNMLPWNADSSAVKNMLRGVQNDIDNAQREKITPVKSSFMDFKKPPIFADRPVPETVYRPKHTPPPPRPPSPPAAYEPPRAGIPKAAVLIATGVSLAASGAQAKISAPHAPKEAQTYTVSAATTKPIAPLHAAISKSNERVDAVNQNQPSACSSHPYTDKELGFSKRSLEDGTLTVGEVLDGKVFSSGYSTHKEDNIYCALAKRAVNAALDDSEQDEIMGATRAEERALNYAISKIRRTNGIGALIEEVHAHCKPPSEKAREEKARAQELLATPLSILTKDIVGEAKKLIFSIPKPLEKNSDQLDRDEIEKKSGSLKY